MPQSEWTSMAIASAVAIVATSFLAIDAGVVNTSVLTNRLEIARASIADVTASRRQLAFAVLAWTHKDQQKQDQHEPRLEQCLATD
jgi:hypothetical protein